MKSNRQSRSDDRVPRRSSLFEMLRRENEKQHKAIRLGVLCGSVVIIPAEAKEALLQQTGAKIKLTFSAIGSLSENDYLKVTATGDAHALTAAVTAILPRAQCRF